MNKAILTTCILATQMAITNVANGQFFGLGRRHEAAPVAWNKTPETSSVYNSSCGMMKCRPNSIVWGHTREIWRPWPGTVPPKTSTMDLKPLPSSVVPDALDETSVFPRERPAAPETREESNAFEETAPLDTDSDLDSDLSDLPDEIVEGDDSDSNTSILDDLPMDDSSDVSPLDAFPSTEESNAEPTEDSLDDFFPDENSDVDDILDSLNYNEPRRIRPSVESRSLSRSLPSKRHRRSDTDELFAHLDDLDHDRVRYDERVQRVVYDDVAPRRSKKNRRKNKRRVSPQEYRYDQDRVQHADWSERERRATDRARKPQPISRPATSQERPSALPEAKAKKAQSQHDSDLKSKEVRNPLRHRSQSASSLQTIPNSEIRELETPSIATADPDQLGLGIVESSTKEAKTPSALKETTAPFRENPLR